MQLRNAKPRTKPYKLFDGGGLYLEVLPSASKFWRMKFRQASGKESRLRFGPYPEVSLSEARMRRDETRALRRGGTDPAQARRSEKATRLLAATQTFQVVALLWLDKTKAERADSTRRKIFNWLRNDIFPVIGNMPITEVRPRDVLAALRVIERRGAIETAHNAKRAVGQVFRFGVASDLFQRDVTRDLRDALASVPAGRYAAITGPGPLRALLRAIYDYDGHPSPRAALKISPMLFQRPGMIRAMEWQELDLQCREWRIPGKKMKMQNDHIVPLPSQAVEILRHLRPLTGKGKYVFPGMRSHDRCMSENTINAALRSMGFSAEVMTGHGFRATARTILDEVLGERVDLIEHQLAPRQRSEWTGVQPDCTPTRSPGDDAAMGGLPRQSENNAL
ncbi:integrase arm-type DNA-binding domain-containing protein [Duganella sp. CF517]|uniref:tyrosine-type recombinase/integrase n=1 Tax=Duganella sp. CF517 TaxID=1881038 RepID=UPI0027D7DE21|nr:integrase arm-type DNA-binding domain-containing protein [Duganella sp. CF517]